MTDSDLNRHERPTFAAMHGFDLLYSHSPGVIEMRRREFSGLVGGDAASLFALALEKK